MSEHDSETSLLISMSRRLKEALRARAARDGQSMNALARSLLETGLESKPLYLQTVSVELRFEIHGADLGPVGVVLTRHVRMPHAPVPGIEITGEHGDWNWGMSAESVYYDVTYREYTVYGKIIYLPPEITDGRAWIEERYLSEGWEEE